MKVKLTTPKLIQKERDISSMIPYSHHVNDNIIATKNGDYITTIKLVGRAHIAAGIADVNRWVRDLNTNLRSIPGDDMEHVSFWSHVVRRKEETIAHKEFDNIFCQSLDDKYVDLFSKTSLMVNELYLTICYRPIVDSTTGFFAKFEKSSYEERLEQQEAYIQKLNDIANLLLQGFRLYEPIRLGVYQHKNRRFCQALELYNYILTHKKQRVPVTKERYYNYLSSERLLFSEHGEIGEVRHIDHSKYFGMLELKEYDDITVPGHFNMLMQENCEMVITQSYTILSKVAALGFLKRHQKHMIDSEDLSVTQIEKITEALDGLTSGNFMMGEHHMTVCVYDDKPSSVKSKLQTISTDMTEVGIVPTYLDLALESGFFAQLPANFKHIPRPAPISSYNFWDFNSLHNFMTGKLNNNPWGSAVSMFKSLSGSPYFFNFHFSPKYENSTGKTYDGNTLIIGKTGAGKTTLCSFLIAQMMDTPNLRFVAFDKDYGLEVFIRAVGGKYLPLLQGKPTGFNPLQLPDNHENRKFIKQWLLALINGDGNGITYNDEQEIDKAIEINFKHDQEHRRLSIFQQALPNPHTEVETRPTVKQRLDKWCQNGEFGWVFDNPKDLLDVSKYNAYGFDVTNFLDVPELRGVIMMYLTYRTQQLINGSPFLYFFDEYWKLSEDEFFQDLIRNKLKTIRKENGICVFATQEPADALRSPIAKTLVSQCSTKVLLENPTADYEDYVKGLKLTETEYNLVKNIPGKSYQFLVKQGNADESGNGGQSSMLKFHLPDFDREMLILSGTPDNAELVREIIDDIGSENPDDWLPLFYQKHGFDISVPTRT